MTFEAIFQAACNITNSCQTIEAVHKKSNQSSHWPTDLLNIKKYLKSTYYEDV